MNPLHFLEVLMGLRWSKIGPRGTKWDIGWFKRVKEGPRGYYEDQGVQREPKAARMWLLGF